MLLQKETNPHLNTITAYAGDYLEINRERYYQSLSVRPEGAVQQLAIKDASHLDSKFLQDLLGVQKSQDPMAFFNDQPSLVLPTEAPEVLIIGTGTRQIFLNPAITTPLLGLGVGVEVMSTPAAARTYNILMAEERRVLAVLLLGA